MTEKSFTKPATKRHFKEVRGSTIPLDNGLYTFGSFDDLHDEEHRFNALVLDSDSKDGIEQGRIVQFSVSKDTKSDQKNIACYKDKTWSVEPQTEDEKKLVGGVPNLLIGLKNDYYLLVKNVNLLVFASDRE